MAHSQPSNAVAEAIANVDLVKIKRALISVSDKTGLVEFVEKLIAHGVEIISTGGTSKLLQEKGFTVKDISAHTGFPEMLDGRVKTLHPKVHGGLLGVRDNPSHVSAMREHQIEPIDLVVINLYPFEATVTSGAKQDDCIEQIDIGGPSMVRSAAKNHRYVSIIVDPADYTEVIAEMEQHHGSTHFAFRQKKAAKAFAATASYDAAISQWFAKELGDVFPDKHVISGTRLQHLRYGENPIQGAAFYRVGQGGGIASAKQLQGKELSYNNIQDADAALEMVCAFQESAVAIVKHANPCGLAIGAHLPEAFAKALACDPVSAFGGIIACNKPIDLKTAEAIATFFVEVVIAPSITSEAKTILETKKNLRILTIDPFSYPHNLIYKTVSGGLLVQDYDEGFAQESEFKIVTHRQPTAQEMIDLKFAFKACKFVKSNAILLAKEGATIGIGAGQMSRVDSVDVALMKAAQGDGNQQRAQGAALASDAFFPFPDGLLKAIKGGVKAVIQPGGSVKDPDVIAAANDHDVAMILTGRRHFRH
ncbi:MAG: bifunctional phosphoribosylaminoimidazolecarboxamide formyltransferase/IMP cyclohydrolase [Alphaproteobacteria bacterium]|nr:bifunctional phosphoribosylaminoimidazolecarboxamide formyltransferase/IMP cyclohydrolase [Alphaproteobacteria bacterium]